MSEEWINSDGSFGDMGSAPESVSKLVETKGFKSVDELAVGYADEASFKGSFAEKLNIPETITDEMTAQIRTRMGVPADVDGYDLGDAGSTLKPEVIDALKKFGIESGLGPEQLKGGINLINEIGNAQKQDTEAQALATEEELKAELGDKFQAYVDDSVEAANKLGLLEVFEETGLIARKDVMEKLNAVNKLIGEGVLKKAPAIPAKTTKETRAEIEANPAFTNGMHPEHQKVLADWHATFSPTG